MENVVDALYMSVSVLILIIALTVSISSFTSLKTQVEKIVTAEDAIDLAQDENGYLNYLTSEEDARTVGVDTLISSLRRITIERYTIYILDKNGNKLYSFSLSDTQIVDDKIEGLYDEFQNSEFKEYIGIYQNNTEVSSANKETYRIITYQKTT